MDDFSPEGKLGQLAGGSVEQIQRVGEAVESKLKADPEGVKDLEGEVACPARTPSLQL